MLIELETRSWNRGIICDSFNSFVAKKIISIPIYFRLSKDRLTWHWEKSGQYSVRSGHHLTRDNSSREVAKDSNARGSVMWKKIWAFKGPKSA